MRYQHRVELLLCFHSDLCSTSDIRTVSQGSTVHDLPYIHQLFQKFLVSGIGLYFSICCLILFMQRQSKGVSDLVYVSSKRLHEEGSTVQVGCWNTETSREMWKVSQEIFGKGRGKSWDVISRLPEMPEEVSLVLPTTDSFSASLFSWY